MKALIPVLLILASFSAGQVYTTPSREIVDYQCDFCGAKIQKAEDVRTSWSIDPGINMAGDPYFSRIPDSLRLQNYKFERKYTLCPKCGEDYHEELDKMYVQAFRKWFKHHERGFRKSWIKNNKILRAERIRPSKC